MLIAITYLCRPVRDRAADGRPQPRSVTPAPTPAVVMSTSTIPSFQIPHKLQHSAQKMQFTCEILTQSVPTGRMDFKAFKALLTRVTPNKLLVIKGAEEDFSSVMAHCKTNGIECYAPQNRHSVTFSMHADHLQIHIPHHLLPKHYAKFTKSATSSLAGDCTVYSLQGEVMLTAQSWSAGSQEGSRLLRYQGVKGVENEQEDDNEQDLFKQLLQLEEERLGAVSVGEVTLNQLKQAYEAIGMKAEFHIGSQGGVLMINDQVILRKENNNFVIEGPPIKTYYDVRRVLYQQCAFL